jgi:hypothetical protein
MIEMFLLRSAFWLTIGFMIMAPHGTDFGAMADSLKDQAVASAASAGEELLSHGMLPVKYASTALIDVTASTPSTVVLPMQDSPTAPAVLPRHRPVAMG